MTQSLNDSMPRSSPLSPQPSVLFLPLPFRDKSRFGPGEPEALAYHVGNNAKEPTPQRSGNGRDHHRTDQVTIVVWRHAKVPERQDKNQSNGGHQHQRHFLLGQPHFSHVGADQKEHAQQPKSLFRVGVTVERNGKSGGELGVDTNGRELVGSLSRTYKRVQAMIMQLVSSGAAASSLANNSA